MAAFKSTTFLFLCVFAAVAAMASAAAYDAAFADFKVKFNRSYANLAEESKRRQIFEENMRIAAKLQARNPHAKFGPTIFADMDAAEFKVYHNGDAHFKRQVASRKPISMGNVSASTSAIDWRDYGAVTQVKNQGQCGSCWSFSTTGNIEGQWAIAQQGLVSLSEQELVSCDTTNNGCNGGLMDNAFSWLISNQGGSIVTAASYPYVSGQGNIPSCSLAGTSTGATISGYQDIPQAESSMAAYCASHGPISVAVDATSWQTYQGGVMTDCISQSLDHGVLIVGFDTSAYPPYWIIKNSWTASWGESGYIRIEYGTNQCLVDQAPCSSYTSAAEGAARASGKFPARPPMPRKRLH